MTTTDDFRTRLMAVCDRLDSLHEELTITRAQIAEIEAQGVSYATVHWRRQPTVEQPGIMELLHPENSEYAQQHGRRREYIGTDPAKQAAARARIARWEEYRKAQGRAGYLKEKISDIQGRISMLEYCALGKQTQFGDTWRGLAGIEHPHENE